MSLVLAAFADDVEEFGVISDAKDNVPWHLPPTRGKAAVVRYFEALGSTVEHRVFEPRDIAGTGPHVYATLHMEMAILATGAKLELREVIHHFTFRDDGKIIRWRGSEDTAVSAAAFAK
jgi:ketosteroid isomerase-like protein